MGKAGLYIATACYVYTAGAYVFHRNYNMALVFAAYAVANLGFIMAGMEE